ncbi:interferon gamma-like [Sebastes umbrosus]|uniref:interferon gamma-like n=1 Tax=Sebastes umbrosus TaxID=72105 RepID=UPI00189FE9C5|nr:interferon gamma-like [Sebastes umbrosus]
MVAAARAVVCLSVWLSVCQVSGSHIPVKMNKTIHNLLQHYNIPRKERFNRKPIFSREPLAGKMEGKKMFMGAVLETYEKLISHMLNQLPTPTPQTTGSNKLSATAIGTPAAGTPAAGIASGGEVGADGDVRKELSYILNMVKELKEKRFLEQEKILHELKALKHIQMDDLVVQSKALWELPWLYEEASSLNNTMKSERRRRRRRQARKAKTHPKA